MVERGQSARRVLYSHGIGFNIGWNAPSGQKMGDAERRYEWAVNQIEFEVGGTI